MIRESVPVWAVGLSLMLAVVIAWLFSAIARWLLRAIAQHDQAAATLIMESGLDPIRDTPEFRAVWDAVPRLTTDTPFPGGGRRR